MPTENRNAALKRLVLTALNDGDKASPLVFKESEAAAKVRRQKKTAGAPPFQFAVNYRLDKKTRSAKGDYNTRYQALVALVKVIGYKPWHYATSSWEVHSHQTREAVLAVLSAPLDVNIDVLTVTSIGVSAVFGDPDKLEG